MQLSNGVFLAFLHFFVYNNYRLQNSERGGEYYVHKFFWKLSQN